MLPAVINNAVAKSMQWLLPVIIYNLIFGFQTKHFIYYTILTEYISSFSHNSLASYYN